MIYGLLSRVARVRFTVGYLAALAWVSTAILMLNPQAHDRLVRHASTNLHNLAHGRLGTLLSSAFVVEAGPLYFWMPFLACLLALAELHLHTVRLIVAFVVGHVGATLVVAAALAAAVEFGWMPWSITHATDVGMSYGALAALGALSAAIPRRWRPAWIGWWVSVSVVAVIIDGEFTNAGHAVAVILGVLLATRFRRPIHWTPLRCLMLALSSGFGFLVLAHSWWAMAAGLALGLPGAGLAHLVARRFGRRDSMANAPVLADASTVRQPALSV
ncbi:rhomboid-like protein [Mycobacterium riyadhense]|uniref:rhomboid-like protein n=1 Tax=Mycobacterium riyadhense TaxID=486698 RepID=UPI0019517CFB|nr:rhomboid-like protein [Mycobacterium riyadhense]